MGMLFQAVKNPQQFIQQMMGNSQAMQNPMMRNAIEMYQKKDYEGVEKLAKNLCKEKGMDYEELCKEIKSHL
jgi:hypothetical protein